MLDGIHGLPGILRIPKSARPAPTLVILMLF